MRSSARCGCPPRNAHRTPRCSGRRCSRRRSRSRSRSATSTGPGRPPTSWSSSRLASRARRWSPAPRSLEEGCGSPRATRPARSDPCPTRCGSGTRSAPRTRRRSHASASPRPTAPAVASSGRSWSATPRAPSSTGSKHAGRTWRAHDAGDEPSAPAGNMFRREGDYWLVVFDDRTARIRDLKGMRHLARLLAVPGRELHVLDLVAAEAGTVPRRRRRCRRDPRRPRQGGVPPPSRRDRRGHRGGAGSRGRRTRGAGRLRTRLPPSRALTRGRAGWPRSTSRISVGTRPSRGHPSGSPGDGPDRRAPSAARRTPRANDPHRHLLRLSTGPSRSNRVERLITTARPQRRWDCDGGGGETSD